MTQKHSKLFSPATEQAPIANVAAARLLEATPPYGRFKNDRGDQAYFAACLAFAAWNDLVVSSEFAITSLSNGIEQRPGSKLAPIQGHPRLSCMDHVVCFKKGRHPALLLTQPYDLYRIDEFKELAQGLSLQVHQPPNALASLYYPGRAFVLAVTGPFWQELDWLPEQK